VRQAGKLSERLDIKRANLERLRSMRNRLAPYESALDKFNSMAGSENFQAENPFTRLPTGLVAQDVRETRQELTQGWTLVRKTCSFAKADIKTVMMFISELETRTPPWRLARCDIRALTPAGGIGYVEVHLETLQKEAESR